MTGTGEEFLAAARSAAELLRAPEVAAAWRRPSALEEFGVGALAGHLAYQVLCVPVALEEPQPVEEKVSLAEHYRRVEWIGAGPGADVNVRIREGGERLAAEGAVVLAERVEAALAGLPAALGAADAGRAVRLPFWGPWSLGLADLLVTRTMELVVHCDDLAVSVGLGTPDFPPEVVDSVVGLLARLAVHRHGAVPVLRALARAERAPTTIAAF
ncbi:maleylpyruvate isomerase N-terminal domain-containing protein [Streptomyces sp. NPDC049555]|uniref:maleylpyruvate isomerase N-terminal domain-containing protein n=1 Tax=Streptomyces sp. NPDC049555 TaxID=3154930 RepID=UPI0034234F22